MIATRLLDRDVLHFADCLDNISAAMERLKFTFRYLGCFIKTYNDAFLCQGEHGDS